MVVLVHCRVPYVCRLLPFISNRFQSLPIIFYTLGRTDGVERRVYVHGAQRSITMVINYFESIRLVTQVCCSNRDLTARRTTAVVPEQ